MQQRRLALLSFLSLIVLVANLAYPAIALADDSTPPGTGTPAPSAAGASTTSAAANSAPTDPPAQPTEAGASQTAGASQSTGASQSAVASAGTGSAGAASSSGSVSSQGSGTASATASSAASASLAPTGTNAPTDSPAPVDTATATEAATVEAVLTAVPTGTPVVVLDSQGQAVPLATVQAGQIITNGDPMWCPAGVLPGGAGCTASYNTFTGAGGLLTALAGGSYSGNGVIYVSQNYDSSLESGNIIIDGGSLSNLQNLTIQGGWDFGLNALSSTASLFNGIALEIVSWQAAVAVNNVDIENSTTDGLVVTTTGNISVNNVTSNHNAGSGATLNNTGGTGNITIGGINNFSNNTSDGLNAISTGNINASNITANQNSSTGALLESCGCGAANVSLNGGTFNDNASIGLIALAGGNATLSNLQAFSNQDAGILVDATGNATLANAQSGQNKADGIDLIAENGNATLSNVLSGYNQNAGLTVSTDGNATLKGVDAFDNTNVGALVSTLGNIQVEDSFFGNCFLGYPYSCGTQAVGAILTSGGTIQVSDSQFNNNAQLGLLSITNGKDISLTNVQATGNAIEGAVAIASGPGPVSGAITICGGSFSDNGGAGVIAVSSSGTVAVSPSTQFIGNGAPNVFASSHFSQSPDCGTSGRKGNYQVLDVSEGQSTDGSCTGLVGIVLKLPDGDTLTVPCQTGGPASLSHLAVALLPAKLPDGYNFVSALQADAARDGLTVSFTMPITGAHYKILFWNGSSWVDLGGSTTVDGLFGVSWVSRGIYVLTTK